MNGKRAGIVSAAALLLALAFLASARTGSVDIGLAEVLRCMLGGDSEHCTIINSIRLPRIIYAMLVGGMLGVSGAVLQAVFRNPLTDPYITGISSGAALGAAVAIIAGLSGIIFPAMTGAVLTIFAVYLLSSRRGGSADTTRLLLTGVMAGSLLSSIIMLLYSVFNRDLVRVVFWLMGDLSNIDTGYMPAALTAMALILASVFYFSNDLNIMSAGEDEARSLGVNTAFIKLFYFIAAGLLTGIAVSLSGVIGFVGLIVPHIGRRMTGPDMRWLLPVSFLMGAFFLLIADTAARTLFLPSEIPVGVVTGLIGAPVFISILMKERRG